MNKSLNNITDALEAFVEAHLQLKDIGFGHTSNIGVSLKDNRQLEYPFLHVDYSSTNYNLSANSRGISHKLYTMSLTVLDKYSPNTENSSEVMSDTEAMLADVVQYFMNSSTMKEFRLDVSSITAQPVRDEDKDGSEGWTALIPFKIPYQFCASNLPIGAAPPDNGGGQPSTYSIQDTDGTVLYSGGITAGGALVQVINDTVVQNSDLSYDVTVNAEGTLILADITVTDSDGSTSSVPAMTDVVCSPALDANVSNSDDSYTEVVASGGDLELPDVTVNATNSSGTELATATIPSVQDHTLSIADVDVNVNSTTEGQVPVGDIDVNVQDSGGSPVTPDAITLTGNTLTLEVATPSPSPVGATLMQTGQATSYRTGDNPNAGRAIDFFTLATNNPFGNTNRFTDELGGTAYANDIVIDWSTYDNIAGTVLGYKRTINTSNVNWNTAIDQCLLVSIGTFTTGWRLPNRAEMFNIMVHEGATFNYPLNYAPFNISLATIYWSATSTPTGTQAFTLTNNASCTLSSGGKTANGRYFPCRTFTVTGTTLT